MNKPHSVRFSLFFFILLFCLCNLVQSQPSIDYKILISKADLLYDKPVSSSKEVMPVGNVRMVKDLKEFQATCWSPKPNRMKQLKSQKVVNK